MKTQRSSVRCDSCLLLRGFFLSLSSILLGCLLYAQLAASKAAAEKASVSKAAIDKHVMNLERQIREQSTEIQTLMYKVETVELAKKRLERDLEISQVCAAAYCAEV
jgi:hypothetical protein